MKLFKCDHCGNVLYFENHTCERCQSRLGFDPGRMTMVALAPDGDILRSVAAHDRRYRFDANAAQGACNWLIPADSDAEFCASCRHNHMIPDLSAPRNAALWQQMEIAKHRLIYQLMQLRLPLENRADAPGHGLVFDILADPPAAHAPRVLTGHDNGLITMALIEADDAERESRRTAMGEPYRALLGHFRHEVGHYYWDRIVRDENRLDAFRENFGDEREDYAAALQRHYDSGPPADWQERFVSTYATSHPWEDWAETWAHYLHICDTMETAHNFGLRVAPRIDTEGTLEADLDANPYRVGDIQRLIDDWLPLTFALNSLNRAMGLRDLYPFVLTPPVIAKLGFVHDVVRAPHASPAG